MYTYQNKPVTLIRDAVQGDVGFDASIPNQGLVRNQDGTTQVVLKSALTASTSVTPVVKTTTPAVKTGEDDGR